MINTEKLKTIANKFRIFRNVKEWKNGFIYMIVNIKPTEDICAMHFFIYEQAERKL